MHGAMLLQIGLPIVETVETADDLVYRSTAQWRSTELGPKGIEPHRD